MFHLCYTVTEGPNAPVMTLADASGPIEFHETERFLADRVIWASKHNLVRVFFVKIDRSLSSRNERPENMPSLVAKHRKARRAAKEPSNV